MSDRFLDTALSVLTDISREVMTRARADGDTEVSETEAQRLYNATRACLDLGASTAQIAAALSGGLTEGRQS